MNIKKLVTYSFKITLCTALFYICFIISSVIIPTSPEITAKFTPAMQESLFRMLLLVSFIATVIISIVIKLSKWHGLKLVVAVTIAFWGIEYVVGLMDMFLFNFAYPEFTTVEIIKSAIRGMLSLIIFVPIAVLLFGKKDSIEENIDENKIAINIKKWILKAIGFAIVFILIYNTFGYLIVWQNPEMRLLYSGSVEKLGYIEQFIETNNNIPLFIPFQFFRGLLFIGFSLPIILMMRGSKRKTILGLILLCLYQNKNSLLPNPMFNNLSIVHFIETTLSAPIYGALMGYLFFIPNDEKNEGKC